MFKVLGHQQTGAPPLLSPFQTLDLVPKVTNAPLKESLPKRSSSGYSPIKNVQGLLTKKSHVHVTPHSGPLGSKQGSCPPWQDPKVLKGPEVIIELSWTSEGHFWGSKTVSYSQPSPTTKSTAQAWPIPVTMVTMGVPVKCRVIGLPNPQNFA